MVTRKKSADSGGGRRERRREETSEKLFAAAVELFSRNGFAKTTIEDITRAADVGKGTFFNYFPSKEHVLGYLVGRQQGTVHEHLKLAQEEKSPSREILLSLARSLLRYPGKSPQMARSLMQAFLGNIEVRQYILREMAVARRGVAEIIRMGQERGELRDEFPPAELAIAFHRVLMGTALMWALDPELPLEKQLRSTMRLVFSGMTRDIEPAKVERREATPRKAARGAGKRERSTG